MLNGEDLLSRGGAAEGTHVTDQEVLASRGNATLAPKALLKPCPARRRDRSRYPRPAPSFGDALKIFSRKSAAARVAANEVPIDPSHWIGRKFRTSLTVQESLAAFDSIKDECYAIRGREAVTWTVPTSALAFGSTQGKSNTVPPATVVAYALAQRGRITLALWDGMVSYGDGTGAGGPPREMWFVPSGFDQSPIPIAGLWKARDSSLSSIGWVESPLWGAR